MSFPAIVGTFQDFISYTGLHTGSLPPEWAPMQLTQLGAPGNALTGRLPEAWHTMTMLSFLDLESNLLNGADLHHRNQGSGD